LNIEKKISSFIVFLVNKRKKEKTRLQKRETTITKESLRKMLELVSEG